jgi:hypothetical protein
MLRSGRSLKTNVTYMCAKHSFYQTISIVPVCLVDRIHTFIFLNGTGDSRWESAIFLGRGPRSGRRRSLQRR